MAENDLGYDENALTKDLLAWWEEEIGGGNDDPFAVPKPLPGTIYDVLPAIDSHTAVTGLVIVETHVGFELSSRDIGRLIRRGGYNGFKDMMNDLIPKLRMVVAKYKGASGLGGKEERNEASATRGPLSAPTN